MQITELHIKGFGKFQDFSLDFGPGINLIYGQNEAGKSTLHAFLCAMLFGLSERRGSMEQRSRYEALRPWQAPEIYGGSLDFSHEERAYRVERDFARSPEDLRIIDKESGKPVADPKKLLSEALCGLTETGYLSTVSIGQLKAAAGPAMAAELGVYIQNLNTTGSMDLSAEAALSWLRRKKEQLSLELQPEAARNYARALSAIKQLEAELSQPENENRLAPTRDRSEALQKEAEALRRQEAALSLQMEKERKTLSDSGLSDETSVAELLEEANTLYEDHREAEKRLRGRRKPFLSIFCLILGLLLAAASVCMLVYGDLYPGSLPGTWFVEVGAMLSGLGLRYLGYSPQACALAAAVGAVACFSFSIGVLFVLRKNRRIMDHTGSLLSDLLKRHTGGVEVSEAAMEVLSARMEGFRNLCRKLVLQEAEQKELQEKLSSLGKETDVLQSEIEIQKQTQEKVEARLTKLRNYRNQAEELKRVTAENERLQKEIDAVSIAQETIQRLGGEIRKSLGTYLNQEAGELIARITGGVWGSLDVGSGTDIRLCRSGQMVPLSRLSAGTMDQVYLAVRLAAVHLIEGGKKAALPLILDDSFALYDDARLSQALTALWESVKAGETGQILMFSCHRREAGFFTKNNTPYKMICIGTKPQHHGDMDRNLL